MHNDSFFVSDQKARADRNSRELVEEVIEEHLVEGDLHQLRLRINLCHKVLVLELVPGEPLNSFVETFGNGEKFDVLLEAFDIVGVVFGDLRPSFERRIVELHFVGAGDVGVNRSNVRNHGACSYCQKDSQS